MRWNFAEIYSLHILFLPERDELRHFSHLWIRIIATMKSTCNIFVKILLTLTQCKRLCLLCRRRLPTACTYRQEENYEFTKMRTGKTLALCSPDACRYGCAPAATSEPETTVCRIPGHIHGDDEGNNGPLTISMTFTKDASRAFPLTRAQRHWTCSAAIDKLSPDQDNQSLDVDLVSGATYRARVSVGRHDCVKQAGGDVSC
jgi:hypothetical protein